MLMRALRPKATLIGPPGLPSATVRSVSGQVSPRPSRSISRLRALRSAHWWSGPGAAAVDVDVDVDVAVVVAADPTPAAGPSAGSPPNRARWAWHHSASQRACRVLKAASAGASSQSRRASRWAGVSSARVCAMWRRRSGSASRPAWAGRTTVRRRENGSGVAADSISAPCCQRSPGSGRSRMCSTTAGRSVGSTRPSRRIRRALSPALSGAAGTSCAASAASAPAAAPAEPAAPAASAAASAAAPAPPPPAPPRLFKPTPRRTAWVG